MILELYTKFTDWQSIYSNLKFNCSIWNYSHELFQLLMSLFLYKVKPKKRVTLPPHCHLPVTENDNFKNP